MKFAYLFALLLIWFAGEAQKIENFYNYKWEPADPSHARFYSIVEKKDSLWHRLDYFISQKSLQMDGYFADSSCKYSEGPFRYYHPNGMIKKQGTYKNNKKQGVWISYHSNGVVEDSVYYEQGMVEGYRLGWNREGTMVDSAHWTLDGKGVDVTWFDNGSPSYAILYLNGKPNGKWKYFHKNGHLSDIEIYQDGTLMSKQYFDESGNPLSDTTNRDHEPRFPGGKEAWKKFLMNHLYFPSQWKIVNSDQVTEEVVFAIDEEGNLKEIEITIPFHPDFDKIVLEALEASPKWIPAVGHNRKVKYYISQTVSFANNNN